MALSILYPSPGAKGKNLSRANLEVEGAFFNRCSKWLYSKVVALKCMPLLSAISFPIIRVKLFKNIYFMYFWLRYVFIAACSE